MKRTLILLLAVFLVLFVGCSATSNDKTTKQAEAKDETVKEEAVNEEPAEQEPAKEEPAEQEVAEQEAAGQEAANEETAADGGNEYESIGIQMDLSKLIENSKGMVIPNPIGAIDINRDLYAMTVTYIGMPKEEASAILYNNNSSSEDSKKVRELQAIIHIILASDIDHDATLQSISEFLGIDYTEEFARAEVIGTADGFTFYSIPENHEEEVSKFDEEYAEEYEKLRQELLEIEKSAKLFTPVDPLRELTGTKLEFSTTDLDGNPVTSEELFAANEITMVNCWGLWCGNCMKEMAELKEIHKELQEKGCGIVGLEFEYDWDDETVQQSKDFFSENGITYPNVMLPDDLHERVPGFPTTYFVDKEGTILYMPIVGAYVDRYKTALDTLLNGNTSTDTTANNTANVEAESQEIVYNVYVTDENGPVEGVTIQFCSTISCMMDKTDAKGLASFTMPAGEIYDVHVLRVPEGYEKDETLYHTNNESSDVQIQLKKKQ